jgi:hypothetical protein
VNAPLFTLLYTPEASRVLEQLRDARQHATKYKKVRKTLKLLEAQGPRYPALHSHAYHSIPGPNGATVWESYVENKTPGAWRIWWIYGPADEQITIITIGPHPD